MKVLLHQIEGRLIAEQFENHQILWKAFSSLLSDLEFYIHDDF